MSHQIVRNQSGITLLWFVYCTFMRIAGTKSIYVRATDIKNFSVLISSRNWLGHAKLILAEVCHLVETSSFSPDITFLANEIKFSSQWITPFTFLSMTCNLPAPTAEKHPHHDALSSLLYVCWSLEHKCNPTF